MRRHPLCGIECHRGIATVTVGEEQKTAAVGWQLSLGMSGQDLLKGGTGTAPKKKKINQAAPPQARSA